MNTGDIVEWTEPKCTAAPLKVLHVSIDGMKLFNVVTHEEHVLPLGRTSVQPRSLIGMARWEAERLTQLRRNWKFADRRNKQLWLRAMTSAAVRHDQILRRLE